jgi:hypothetical protein
VVAPAVVKISNGRCANWVSYNDHKAAQLRKTGPNRVLQSFEFPASAVPAVICAPDSPDPL